MIKAPQQRLHGLGAQLSLEPGCISGWWRRQGIRHARQIEWIEHIFALVTSGICGRAIPLTQPGATVQSQSIVGDTTHRPTLFIGYISSEGAGGDSKFLRNLGCAMPPESHLDRTSHRRQMWFNVPFYFSSFRLRGVRWRRLD